MFRSASLQSPRLPRPRAKTHTEPHLLVQQRVLHWLPVAGVLGLHALARRVDKREDEALCQAEQGGDAVQGGAREEGEDVLRGRGGQGECCGCDARLFALLFNSWRALASTKPAWRARNLWINIDARSPSKMLKLTCQRREGCCLWNVTVTKCVGQPVKAIVRHH